MSQQTFSDLQSQTSKNYRVNIFSRNFRNLFSRLFKKVRFYGYENILLRLFFEISTEGSFEKLVISGSANLEQCLEQWEKIVKRNSEENSSFQYQTYFSLLHGYSVLLAQHNTVKLLLLKATLTIDDEVINELTERGYKIEYGLTKDQLESVEKARPEQKILVEKMYRSSNYAKSIEDAQRKSNTLVTKINMKRSEIELMHKENKKGHIDSFEDVVSALEDALGGNRSLPDDITLAKFNSLRKVAKRKSDAMRKIGKK